MKTIGKKTLKIKSSKLMNSLFFGNFKAAFSGKGLEFQDFREYNYGDDARYIDWGVSSREQSIITRRYREEKQGNILCAIDVRESLDYADAKKKEVYREVLELLFHASKNSGESFGGYILDADSAHYIAPQKTEIGLQKLKKLSEKRRKNTDTLSLDFLLKSPIKRSVVFIISDSMNIDEKSFKLASIKYDLIFVYVSSYFENTLAGTGVVSIRGMRKGYGINLDDTDKREQYISQRKKQVHTFFTRLRKLGVDSLMLDEQTSLLPEFLTFMKQREKS